jgi:hypothetical protein
MFSQICSFFFFLKQRRNNKSYVKSHHPVSYLSALVWASNPRFISNLSVPWKWTKLGIVSWNWVSVWKICNEIAYCFMKLGINSENLQQNWVLFHETGYQFRKLAAKLGFVSWNWVSVHKSCSKIGFCFVKLGISSENLQQNWVLFHETGYQFKRFAALYSNYTWFNVPIRKERHM